jgi:hypothetical protein
MLLLPKQSHRMLRACMDCLAVLWGTNCEDCNYVYKKMRCFAAAAAAITPPKPHAYACHTSSCRCLTCHHAASESVNGLQAG